MDGREIEARVLIWAVAEISWQDASGAPCRAQATLENTSSSGACLRLKKPVAVGSVVSVKWHREQFSGVARNCRQDGGDFLLGVKRQTTPRTSEFTPPSAKGETLSGATGESNTPAKSPQDHPLLRALHSERARRRSQAIKVSSRTVTPEKTADSHRSPGYGTTLASNHGSSLDGADATLCIPDCAPQTLVTASSPARNNSAHPGAPSRLERKDMKPKRLFPTFWRRAAQQQDRSEAAHEKEIVVNRSNAPDTSSRNHEMLSYEDIYNAAGVMKPPTGYGLHKIVEMLNSDRIRDLSKEIKRASLLMALDAAGISADDVLTDARRRQEALNSYEAGKKKQVEDFEAAQSREIAQIEQEMERVQAHYRERVQHNRDLITKEKEMLRNWQGAVQHEIERIGEVIEMCSLQPAPAAAREPSRTASEPSAGQARAASLGQGN
jgi:hypothetical protein